MIKNKTGEEKFLTPIYFIVWAVVITTIIIALIISYSNETSVQAIEARVLVRRIADCINNEGYQEEGILNKNSEGKYNLLEKCALNEEKIIVSGDFYINIGEYDINGNLVGKNITLGNKDLWIECKALRTNKNSEKFGACKQKNLYVLKKEINPSTGDEEINDIIININTGSRNKIKRIN